MELQYDNGVYIGVIVPLKRGIWGSSYNIPLAIFSLLKGDYN